MTDISPTASGSPAPRKGRTFQAAAPREPRTVLDEKLTAPAGYGSSAAPPTEHTADAAATGAPAPYTGAWKTGKIQSTLGSSASPRGRLPRG